MRVVVTVNNDDNAASMDLPAGNAVEYIGALSGQKVAVQDGRINVTVPANSGEIWVPSGDMPEYKPFKVEISLKEETVTDEESIPADSEAPSSATEPVHFRTSRRKTCLLQNYRQPSLPKWQTTVRLAIR